MSSSQEIQTIREIIRSLLEEYNILYKVPELDNQLYQQCVDEAVGRGHPISDDHPLRRYLQDSVNYVANSCAHYTYRPTQVWLALYLATTHFVGDVPSLFPAEIPNICVFSDRFLKAQEQGNATLDALADVIRQSPNLFPLVVSNLITMSTLDLITSTLLECETASVEMLHAAQRPPTLLRTMPGVPEALAFMVFPREIPLDEYVQGIPQVMQFIRELNEILTFYKEQLEGENTNRISTTAVRNNETKLEALERVVESVTDLHKSVVKILERSPAALDAFRRFVFGYFHFHFSLERYKLADLNL